MTGFMIHKPEEAIIEYPDHTEIYIPKLFQNIVDAPYEHIAAGKLYGGMDPWFNDKKKKFEKELETLLANKIVSFISSEKLEDSHQCGMVQLVSVDQWDGQIVIWVKKSPSDPDPAHTLGLYIDTTKPIIILKKGKLYTTIATKFTSLKFGL